MQVPGLKKVTEVLSKQVFPPSSYTLTKVMQHDVVAITNLYHWLLMLAHISFLWHTTVYLRLSREQLAKSLQSIFYSLWFSCRYTCLGCIYFLLKTNKRDLLMYHLVPGHGLKLRLPFESPSPPDGTEECSASVSRGLRQVWVASLR